VLIRGESPKAMVTSGRANVDPQDWGCSHLRDAISQAEGVNFCRSAWNQMAPDTCSASVSPAEGPISCQTSSVSWRSSAWQTIVLQRFHNRPMAWTARAVVVGSAFMLGCSPVLDWREVRPEGTELVALFPCKPKSRQREVTLGGKAAKMTMAACETGDLTFALGFSDVADPAQVKTALGALWATTAGNVAGKVQQQNQPSIPGMTPNDEAVRLLIEGQLPTGSVTHIATMLFVRGTVVFQASVVGASLDDGAVDIFFSSLKFGG